MLNTVFQRVCSKKCSMHWLYGYLAGIYLSSMQASEYLPLGRQVKLIYPDTLPTFGTGQVPLSGLFPSVMRPLRSVRSTYKFHPACCRQVRYASEI